MGLTTEEQRKAALTRSRSLYGEQYSRLYRDLDLREAESDYYNELSDRLRRLADSVGRPVEVVDFGCGTGRYFHAMGAASKLTGIDLSEHMLSQARNPVRPTAARETRLVCGGLEQMANFPEGSVDFIYSVGVFGEHAPLEARVLETMHRALRDGGIFYFSVLDSRPRNRVRKTLKRRLMEGLYPALPTHTRRNLDVRWLNMSFGNKDLRRIIESSPFGDGLIEEETILPDSYDGRHHYCTLKK